LEFLPNVQSSSGLLFPFLFLWLIDTANAGVTPSAEQMIILQKGSTKSAHRFRDAAIHVPKHTLVNGELVGFSECWEPPAIPVRADSEGLGILDVAE
jgi:hypothetical protein